MGNRVWWNAYQDLMTNRPESARRRLPIIPEREIRSYARDYGLDVVLLKLIVWGVDKVFIEHMFRQSEE